MSDGSTENWADWQPRLCRRWAAMARGSLRMPPADVEDLVQEVVARSLRHNASHPFASEDDAARWGVMVLANLVRDRARYERRHRAVAYEDDMADVRPGVDHDVERREVSRIVAEVVASLPESDQAVIRARFHDEMSYEAAAATLGLARTAYGVRLHRALAKVRAKLGAIGLQAPVPVAIPRRYLRRVWLGVVVSPVVVAATVHVPLPSHSAPPRHPDRSAVSQRLAWSTSTDTVPEPKGPSAPYGAEGGGMRLTIGDGVVGIATSDEDLDTASVWVRLPVFRQIGVWLHEDDHPASRTQVSVPVDEQSGTDVGANVPACAPVPDTAYSRCEPDEGRP